MSYSMKFSEKPNGFDPNKVLLLEPKKDSDKLLQVNPAMISAIIDSDKGLRFNEGKIRYDLFEPYAIEQLAKVFTIGANKYAERNWEKGMKWSKVIASLKRHIAKFEMGEDYDDETGLPHMSHAAWNAMALVSYMKIHPYGDDRDHKYLKPLKIGLDIDGVLADFVGHLMNVSGNKGHIPYHWNDPLVRVEFDKIKEDKDFWLSIPPFMEGKDIPFETHCYITARSIDPEITQAWLDKNGFPKAKLYCVKIGDSKVEIAKQAGMDVFVDDSYSNFVELNNAGIFTYLYTAPYNKRYNVGHRRINSLNDI